MRRLLILPIRLYQLLLSPLLGPRCRFYPSCSSYAVEAITIHGAMKGSYLATRRLLRCHPWNPGGLDPVPPRGRASVRAGDTESGNTESGDTESGDTESSRPPSHATRGPQAVSGPFSTPPQGAGP
jgi:uncharacterized protein